MSIKRPGPERVNDLNLLTLRLKTDHPVFLEPKVEPHPQLAAVLVIFFRKKGRTHVLLAKRASGLKKHAGEISFPGGVYEEEDGNLLSTALRETREEIQLEIEESAVFSRLPTVKTLTEFTIAPFVTIQENLPPYKRNPDEVQEVLEAPFVSLLATRQLHVGYDPSMEMFEYWHGANRIWGATARILHRIAMIC